MTTIRLRALSGTPLTDDAVREMVVASAHGLAERSGVMIERLDVAPEGITALLRTERIVAVGFAAELRRLTNGWYERKFRDGPLWGTPAPGTLGGDEETDGY